MTENVFIPTKGKLKEILETTFDAILERMALGGHSSPTTNAKPTPIATMTQIIWAVVHANRRG